MIAPFHIFPLKIAFPCKPAGEAASAKSLADRLLFAVTPHSSGTYVRTCVRTRARTTTCASAHVTKWAQGAQAAGAASGLDARAASARKRHWDTYRSNPSQDSTAMPRAQIRTYARTHCHVKDAGVSLPCEGFSTYVRTHVQFRRPIQGCKSSRPFRGRARDARDQRPELRMTVIKCKVRTYVRMCLRAHVRRFLPNASNQTPARIPVNAAAGRRKGAEIDRRKGAVRERELVRELRGEMSIGERGASLCEP